MLMWGKQEQKMLSAAHLPAMSGIAVIDDECSSPGRRHGASRHAGSGRFRPTWLILAMYLLATVQVAGCYFTLVRPYINTSLYENGKERLPFQTRVLMMPLMKWAHESRIAAACAAFLSHSKFWYLRPAEPEAIVQLWINLASLMVAGLMAFQIYRAAAAANGKPSGFLAVFVYPVFLLLIAAHYILHTIQNFRFLYDLPSIAFFAVGLWLIYFRKHPLLFMLLFAVATLNRETTLLLLPFFMLSAATRDGDFEWRKTFSVQTLAVVVPLSALLIGWHLFIFHIFKYNTSEYYPRILLNLYTIVHPRYWPQLFSAGGYLLPFVLIFRRSIADRQLRAWLWALPVWFGFMFFWGILVETRVFGELLPYLACVTVLIAEERIRCGLSAASHEDLHFDAASLEPELAEDAAA
jgi:hypothetical protein